LLFGIFDGMKVAAKSLTGEDGRGITEFAQSFIDFVNGMSPTLSILPLYEEGMAWLLPTLVVIVLCLMIRGGGVKAVSAA
ncbi:MAG: branched-chain amino acid transport system II carrier protein, partial [Shewanella sp.]